MKYTVLDVDFTVFCEICSPFREINGHMEKYTVLTEKHTVLKLTQSRTYINYIVYNIDYRKCGKYTVLELTPYRVRSEVDSPNGPK